MDSTGHRQGGYELLLMYSYSVSESVVSRSLLVHWMSSSCLCGVLVCVCWGGVCFFGFG